MLSIIGQKIRQLNNELSTLYKDGVTVNDQQFTHEELYSKKIVVFANQDPEDHRKELIEAIFHLSKVKDEIHKYFKTEETLPKYNKL